MGAFFGTFGTVAPPVGSNPVATADFTVTTAQALLTDKFVQPRDQNDVALGPPIAGALVKGYLFRSPVPAGSVYAELRSTSAGSIGVAALEFGGAESGDTPTNAPVLVAPLTLESVAEVYATNGVHQLKLGCLQGESASWLFGISDSLGAPVVLTGHVISFVVRDANYEDAFAVELGGGVELVAPDQVRVTLTPDLTDRRDYDGQWVLWDLTVNKALGRGAFRIAGAVKAVA